MNLRICLVDGMLELFECMRISSLLLRTCVMHEYCQKAVSSTYPIHKLVLLCLSLSFPSDNF